MQITKAPPGRLKIAALNINKCFYLYHFLILQNSDNEDLDPHERKKLKKIKAMSDSSEEDDEDDDDRLREELQDLIDDNPIEEDGSDDGGDSDHSRREKRKDRSDDELDDRLEDDDYDLLEENLGVKVQRRVSNIFPSNGISFISQTKQRCFEIQLDDQDNQYNF